MTYDDVHHPSGVRAYTRAAGGDRKMDELYCMYVTCMHAGIIGPGQSVACTDVGLIRRGGHFVHQPYHTHPHHQPRQRPADPGGNSRNLLLPPCLHPANPQNNPHRREKHSHDKQSFTFRSTTSHFVRIMRQFRSFLPPFIVPSFVSVAIVLPLFSIPLADHG